MIEKRICPYCGKEFVTRDKRQVYCCAKCCELFHKARLKEERKKEIAEQKCVVCGKPINRTRRMKYCSYACKYAATYKPIKPRNKKPVKPAMTISEICKLAAAEHLTYGQYVEKYGV